MARWLLALLMTLASITSAMPGMAQPMSTESQAAAKYDADLDAYNELMADHDLVDDLDTYLARSRRWLPPTAPANTAFSFDVRPFDETLKRLRAAAALPGSVPDLDPAAARLLAALQAANPIVSDLVRYRATRAFLDDDLAHARAQHAPFVAAMREVMAAADALQAALSDHAVAADRAQVERLPEGSLRRQVMGDGLALRVVERRLRHLKADDDVSALATALAELSAANDAMHTALDRLDPPADYNCGDYAKRADLLLGYGRDQARAAKAGTDPKVPIDRFRDLYPITADSLDKCLAGEKRAQP